MTDSYNEYLLSIGLAPRTVVIYRRKMEEVIRRAGEMDADLDDVSVTTLAMIGASFPNTTSSLRQLRTALQHWYTWRGLPCPPLKVIRVPRQTRGKYRGLEPDEACALVKTALGWFPQGTCVLFGMYLALRREEIASVRWDRFDRTLEWYTVHGKGNKIAELPVHPVLRDELKPTAYPYAFPGRGGGHVTPATIWNWVREVADAAGLPPLQPHQLRHTAIATINDTTGDLRTAQEFARHARPETTAIYTRTTAARLWEAALSLDYLEGRAVLLCLAIMDALQPLGIRDAVLKLF